MELDVEKQQISADVLEQMHCIDCQGELYTSKKGHVYCKKCTRMYPLEEYGYFDFMPQGATGSKNKDTCTREWDSHWRKVANLDSYIISHEVDYFNELMPGAFKDSIVLDVGCGSGRNLEKYLQQRPRALIMTDISDSLFIAVKKWQELRKYYKDTEVVFLRCDIHKMPFRQRTDTTIVYTSCGVFNILNDQDVCIKEAMRFSDYIFILFNSPANVFGKIYYGLNPVRIVMKKLVPFSPLQAFISKIFSYVGYAFVYALIRLLNKEVSGLFTRQALEFLIHDWIFTSPWGTAYDAGYYKRIGETEFLCAIEEQTISRIVFYSCKTG